MQQTTFDFTGSVVVVTGGALGIGGAICQGFAHAGANVLCIDVNQEAGNALAAGDNGPGAIVFFEGDVGKAAAYLLDAENVTGTVAYVDAGYHAMGL